MFDEPTRCKITQRRRGQRLLVETKVEMVEGLLDDEDGGLQAHCKHVALTGSLAGGEQHALDLGYRYTGIVKPLNITRHATTRMAQRDIGVSDLRSVISTGTVIKEYPDDAPYPSKLVLGFVEARPIHVV